ncbi:MAG TPA: 30S ribosomal protein S2, partial [Rhizobiales bacterium]|nr:30S ribosomal protein S2 [Hyphomicrobiales bacterium]
RELEETLANEEQGFTKREMLSLMRERNKLDRSLGGIKDMGGIPDIMFVIDTNKEAIAIKEAKRLNIPVVAILDSNSDPDGVDYPVPGNDDAGRAVSLYCDLAARAAIDGISASQASAGIDVGEAEEVTLEVDLDTPPAEEAQAAPEAEAVPEAEAPAEAEAAPEAEAPAEAEKSE